MSVTNYSSVKLTSLTDADIINLIHDEKRRGVLESTVGSGQWGSSVDKTEINELIIKFKTGQGSQSRFVRVGPLVWEYFYF